MKTLKQVIKENHEISNERYRKERQRTLKKIEKQKKRDKALAYLIAAFIVIITCVCINALNNLNKDFVNTCTKKGYSVQYCMDHM